MDCPKGHGRLKSATVESLRVNRCPACEGTWYDLDELRLLKDKEAHGNYNWIDFDLWKDAEKFRADRQRGYRCPR
ncbi:MAG TPA: zf-TFIIB domain-containing protein, partial [Dehalococcoidia bacterium]|nr:zf-TFIIB domain-containing protein [Dehalococcoidia bacterium]